MNRMNEKRQLAGLLSMLFSMAMPLPVSAESMDFRQCVVEALANNHDLAASQARIDQAESAIRQAEAQRMPKVNLSMTATHSNDPLNAFGLKLGQGNVTATDMAFPVLNSPDAANNLNTRLEVLAPIYTGGQLTALTHQAQAGARAAKMGDSASRQQLIQQVAMAYQGIHSARAYVKVAEQSLQAAQEFLRVTENLLKQGMAVKSDLLTARVNLEDARLRVAEAQRLESGALDQLKLLLSRPLTDELEIGTVHSTSLPEGDEASLLAQARENHPGLKAVHEQLASAQAQVEAAKAGRKPQLNVMARHEWNDEGIGLSASSYTVAGVMSWNAFDGGARRAGIDQARAVQAELLAKLRQTENGLVFAVRDSLRKAKEVEHRLKARDAAVTDAEEAERLTRKRYEHGLATLIDMLAVQTQLDKARADLVAARHDQEISHIELKRAIGTLGEDSILMKESGK